MSQIAKMKFFTYEVKSSRKEKKSRQEKSLQEDAQKKTKEVKNSGLKKTNSWIVKKRYLNQRPYFYTQQIFFSPQ